MRAQSTPSDDEHAPAAPQPEPTPAPDAGPSAATDQPSALEKAEPAQSANAEPPARETPSTESPARTPPLMATDSERAPIAGEGVQQQPSQPQRFGETGQFVITAGQGFGLHSTRYDGSSALRDRVGLVAGFDLFVGHGFSIGADLELSYSVSSGYGADSSLVETKNVLVSGGPRFGFNAPLSERLSFYPRLTLGLHYTNQRESLLRGNSLSIASSPTGSPTLSRVGPWVDLYAPLLLHVAPHFFIGFGPLLYHDFARATGGPAVGAERTSIGASIEVGGYWGGAHAQAASATSASAPTPSSGFGRKGVVVLTGDLDLSGNWSSFSGTDASQSSLSVGPSVDWFCADHVSFGGSLSFSSSRSVGFDQTLGRIDFSAQGVVVAPRIGINAPIATAVSLYPRATLALGAGASRESATFASNNSRYESISLGLSIPVLFHAAEHFFIGFGPYISHDLSRSYSPGDRQNRATQIGISSSVGGWL